MTEQPPGREDPDLALLGRVVDELLDLALELRWKVAHEPEPSANLERRVGEIGGRVARWREQIRARPAVERRTEEPLRHAQNIVAECAAILAGIRGRSRLRGR